jgi:hypothetical protein
MNFNRQVINFNDNFVISASVDGGILIDQQQIAGGPKTYFLIT